MILCNFAIFRVNISFFRSFVVIQTYWRRFGKVKFVWRVRSDTRPRISSYAQLTCYFFAYCSIFRISDWLFEHFTFVVHAWLREEYLSIRDLLGPCLHKSSGCNPNNRPCWYAEYSNILSFQTLAFRHRKHYKGSCSQSIEIGLFVLLRSWKK